MVHKSNSGMDSKSIWQIGIIVLTLCALPVASTSCAASSVSSSSEGSVAGRPDIYFASVGAGLRPALVGGSTGLKPAPADADFTALPDWIELLDAATASPSPSPSTSRERTTIPQDTSSVIRDSLAHRPARLGPPTPRGGAPRRARPFSLGRFFRSPTGTLLKSVAFPGWGQWTNGKKQKAAIYFGIETYFLTKSLIWRHRSLDRLHEWEHTDAGNNAARIATFNSYDSARNSRNYFYWLTGITAFISMFDAYSDAYLLTLERTRKMGDDYWGGQARVAPEDEVRLTVTWRF